MNAPWTETTWRWRKVCGVEVVDRLVHDRLLVPLPPTPEAWRDGVWLEPGLVAQPLSGEPGAYYAIPDDPSFRPFTVYERDLVLLRLDLEALLQAGRRGGGLTGRGAIMDHTVLLFGKRTRSQRDEWFFAVLADPGPYRQRLHEELVRQARGGRAIVLVPRGRWLVRSPDEREYDGLDALAYGMAEIVRTVDLA